MPPAAASVRNFWSAACSGAVDAVPLLLVVLVPVAVPAPALVPVPLVLAALPVSGEVEGKVAVVEPDGVAAVPVDGEVLLVVDVPVDAVEVDVPAEVPVSVDAVLPALSLRLQPPSASAAASAITDRLALRKVVSFMRAP
jgi:hypothetical protein